MKKYLFLFILLFRIYPSICQHTFFIQGFVKDSASQAPLKDVEVVVINNELHTKTNHQGYFTIPVNEKKLYNLMLFIPSYRSLHTRIPSSKTDTIFLWMSPSIVTMDEVVITGTRFATNIKETPILTHIVSSQKMAISGSSQITTALSNTLPGLDFYNEGSGMTFQMQGIEAKYTLFLIDGERMAGENHDNIDYFRLGASNIEKIEIVKGASSTLYGSNAIGGVINLITRTPVKPFEANIYGRYSKFNELESGLNVGFKKNKISSFTDFNRKSTNGYDLTPLTKDNYTVEPYSVYNAFQKFTFTPNAKFSVVVKGGYFRRERFDVSAIPAHPLYEDYNTGISTTYKLNKNTDISAVYHFDHYESFSILEKLDNQKKKIYSNVQQTFQLTAKNTKIFAKKIEKNNLIAGVELFKDDMFSERIQDSSKGITNINFFALNELKFHKKYTFIGGIRYDHYLESSSSFSPKISFMYSQKKLNYRATYGYGFRVPSIKEMYYDFDLGFIFVKGNPNLKPEYSQYGSISVEFSHKRNNASIHLYVNNVTDMIHDVLLANTSNGYTYININKASIRGFDFIQHFYISKNISINGGYSFTYAYDMIKKEELSGFSKHSEIIGIDYAWNKGNYTGICSFSGKISSKKTFDNFNEAAYSFVKDSYPAYSLWKIALIQTFLNKAVEINMGITNIFNYKTQTELINIDPGRRFYGMLTISIDKLTDNFKK